MIYQFDSRVRYSEVDENRRITLLSILNYFQDCSSFHSEKIGFGIDYLKEKQCAWGSVVLADRAWGAAGVWTGDHRSDLAIFF